MTRTDRTPEVRFPDIEPTSGSLIRSCAERFGDHPFVVLGEERLTYAEAEARSADLARGLLVSGAGKGTRVGLLAPNGPDWVVAWLAVTRIGGLAALLTTYSTTAELGRSLRHADVAVLLTAASHLDHDYLARLEGAAPDVVGQPHEHLLVGSHPYLRSVWTWPPSAVGDRTWCAGIDELVARGRHVPEDVLVEVEREVRPSDPMVLVFSSGSTGAPKAAVHSHGATIRHPHNLGQLRPMGPDDVIYTPMPLFWVGGFAYTLVAAMHAGATVVFEERFSPPTTLDLLERERVTQVLGWPHMAKALADDPTFGDRDLSAVRVGTVLRWLPQGASLGATEPRATSLGMTETLGPHTHGDGLPVAPGKEGSFGWAVPGVEHRVVDPVTGKDVPPGEVGELWVRGYSLMLELYKRERSEVFTEDGWYRTGDAGRFDEDGELFSSGRMGDLIKSSGMNVTPREVEEALEAQPEVAVAFVTGVDHPERGQDVVAAVALRPGEALGADEARARVKAALSSYKVPRHVEVLASQADLPMLASGKVDRARLADDVAEAYRSTLRDDQGDPP